MTSPPHRAPPRTAARPASARRAPRRTRAAPTLRRRSRAACFSSEGGGASLCHIGLQPSGTHGCSLRRTRLQPPPPPPPAVAGRCRTRRATIRGRRSRTLGSSTTLNPTPTPTPSPNPSPNPSPSPSPNPNPRCRAPWRRVSCRRRSASLYLQLWLYSTLYGYTTQYSPWPYLLLVWRTRSGYTYMAVLCRRRSASAAPTT